MFLHLRKSSTVHGAGREPTHVDDDALLMFNGDDAQFEVALLNLEDAVGKIWIEVLSMFHRYDKDSSDGFERWYYQN